MDSLTIAARFRVRKNIILHINRKIPGGGKGKIHVHVGQEIAPEDILGEGEFVSGFTTIDISKELSASPKSAFSYLNHKIGQKIFKGELLGVKKELFGLQKKTLFAHEDGILDFYDEGKGTLRIKLLPRVMKMASGVYGIVDQINPLTGEVIIRCMANILYGVCGSGKEREGIIKVIGTPEALISSKQILPILSNQIIVGGGLIFLDALEKAVGLHVSGIISGGINALSYRSMNGGRWNLISKKWADVGITLIVTEGFGSIPIGEDIFNILKSFDGRFCLIDGNRARIILPSTDQQSMISIRKTRLPQGSYVESAPDLGIMTLKKGLMVRTIGSVSLGVIGKVEEIDKTQTLLPNGLKTYLVKVKTKNQTLIVPYSNLEAIV